MLKKSITRNYDFKEKKLVKPEKSSQGVVKVVLHGTICNKSEEIELTPSFKNRMIQILMPKVITSLQFTRSD